MRLEELNNVYPYYRIVSTEQSEDPKTNPIHRIDEVWKERQYSFGIGAGLALVTGGAYATSGYLISLIGKNISHDDLEQNGKMTMHLGVSILGTTLITVPCALYAYCRRVCSSSSCVKEEV